MAATLTTADREHLKRALELAEGGRGKVSPNPLVGAVLVRDGEVIGEGFHARLGELHAERATLEDCRGRGEDPDGATMYVTLEPCAHTGRQPPCVEAILEAGIARVVIGSDDPSEKASGRGPGMLRDGGVQVEFAAGEEATAARLLNQPFRKHARTGLPLVTLKLAMSLDGHTTTPPGASPWISGPESRQLVHQWRTESDAIAVGIGTVLADDPLLTARPAPKASATQAGQREGESGGADADDGTEVGSEKGVGYGTEVQQLLRVVFDSRARLPLDSRLLQTLDQSPVLVVAAEVAAPERLAALREKGAETLIAAGSSYTDRIHSALADLGRRGITSLFLEGGRTLAAAFLAADAIDEARTFVAPILLGDPESVGGSNAPVVKEGTDPAPRGKEGGDPTLQGEGSSPAAPDERAFDPAPPGEGITTPGQRSSTPDPEDEPGGVRAGAASVFRSGNSARDATREAKNPAPGRTPPGSSLATTTEQVGADVLIKARLKEW